MWHDKELMRDRPLSNLTEQQSVRVHFHSFHIKMFLLKLIWNFAVFSYEGVLLKLHLVLMLHLCLCIFHCWCVSFKQYPYIPGSHSVLSSVAESSACNVLPEPAQPKQWQGVWVNHQRGACCHDDDERSSCCGTRRLPYHGSGECPVPLCRLVGLCENGHITMLWDLPSWYVQGYFPCRGAFSSVICFVF